MEFSFKRVQLPRGSVVRWFSYRHTSFSDSCNLVENKSLPIEMSIKICFEKILVNKNYHLKLIQFITQMFRLIFIVIVYLTQKKVYRNLRKDSETPRMFEHGKFERKVPLFSMSRDHATEK